MENFTPIDKRSSPYNGWANYATWCAGQYLGSDQALYHAVRAGADPIELLLNSNGFRMEVEHHAGLKSRAAIRAVIDMDELKECVEELRQ